jgi:hypothetical protein
VTVYCVCETGMLESLCEDYGQAVKYKGTIPGIRPNATTVSGLKLLMQTVKYKGSLRHPKLKASIA